LQLYIRAGEEKLEEMRTITLPKLRAQASESGDPMAVQVVNDFEQSVDRFEKKIHDLKISKTLAIQTAPQIRLIQNNDRVLIDRVQSAIYHTIPLWKNQMVIALGLTRQKETIELQRAVTDATNDLLRRNAEMLKQNSIDTAKANERGIVDIETVKKVNEDLISTIEETLRIQSEGRQRRQAAERELVAIEGRLKDALLKNANRV
ncbi:MAG: toxic anion resistance protein, partial [Selenomonadaceae bacterium]|nr:toxic anion resistance protein [Selenomonadaceae bacterium]